MADGAVASAKIPIGQLGKIHLVFDLSTVARASVGGSRAVGRHCQVRVLEAMTRSACIVVDIGVDLDSWISKLEGLRGSATRVYDVWKSIDL